MIKGGYKIVNFNGAALSGTPETLPGIYAQIVDDYDKPVMVSGVSLNGDIMDDAYAGVQEKVAGDLSKSVELTVYGGIITVTEDDEVSFVLSKTTAELTAEIGDLEDLETEEKDSVVGAINEVNSKVGDLEDLETTEKDSLVGAVNELINGVTLKDDDSITSTNCTFDYKKSAKLGNLALLYLVFTTNSNITAGTKVASNLPLPATNQAIINAFDSTGNAIKNLSVSLNGDLNAVSALDSGHSIRIMSTYVAG